MMPSFPCLLLWTGAERVPNRHPQDPRTSVPIIARIAGLLVGRDTVEDMERRLGKGMAYTGGHPRGAREWIFSRRRGWYIDADGFDYNSRGRVVDSVDLGSFMLSDGSVQRIPPVPLVHTRHNMGWMNVIYPGMLKGQVLRLTRQRLSRPKVQGHRLTRAACGFIKRNDQETYGTWTAIVEFHNGRVTEISVSCK